MFYAMYGEVHGHMEHGFEAVYYSDTESAGWRRWRTGGVWDVRAAQYDSERKCGIGVRYTWMSARSMGCGKCTLCMWMEAGLCSGLRRINYIARISVMYY